MTTPCSPSGVGPSCPRTITPRTVLQLSTFSVTGLRYHSGPYRSFYDLGPPDVVTLRSVVFREVLLPRPTGSQLVSLSLRLQTWKPDSIVPLTSLHSHQKTQNNNNKKKSLSWDSFNSSLRNRTSHYLFGPDGNLKVIKIDTLYSRWSRILNFGDLYSPGVPLIGWKRSNQKTVKPSEDDLSPRHEISQNIQWQRHTSLFSYKINFDKRNVS